MNIIKSVTARIEEARQGTKTAPCKNYATEAAAEKATAEAALRVGCEFDREGRTARYMVLFIASWGRWVGVIDQSEVMMRRTSTGGFLGVAPGFFRY